jgi:hypothetical protein
MWVEKQSPNALHQTEQGLINVCNKTKISCNETGCILSEIQSALFNFPVIESRKMKWNAFQKRVRINAL